MRYIQNERGIALVMVMVFALIGLAIVSAMLFMVTQGTMMSGSNRLYRSADEAGLGGVNVALDMVKNRGVAMPGTTLTFGLDACLNDKLTIAREPKGALASLWLNCNNPPQPAGVDRLSLDPITNSDISQDFNGPGTTFRSQAKIVDTVRGNTDVSGLVTSGQLGGSGVVNASGGQVSPPAIPYLYRVEVQTQNQANPAEVSRYSALYAH